MGTQQVSGLFCVRTETEGNTANFFSVKTCLPTTCSLLCNNVEGKVTHPERGCGVYCHRKLLLLTKMLNISAQTACLTSCIGDWIIAWRRAVGRKARTEVGVNSCLVALIATESVSIALSWLLFPPEVCVNRHGL